MRCIFLRLIVGFLFAMRVVASPVTVVTPKELTNAVLHNPGMGWILYENYPLDQATNGSSTLLTLPNEDFPGVDVVALMFSWQDIEKRQDEYDFSKVDFAYDYWAKRGKEIQLRMSATTLMWWENRNPPAGKGAPDYVLERLAPHEKQIRKLEGIPYAVEDTRNQFYRERLAKFLRIVGERYPGHRSGMQKGTAPVIINGEVFPSVPKAKINEVTNVVQRPVTLIDLRGFGVWGEWHSGFQYSTLKERHDALKGLIDLWCEALPQHQLALSYSYDPDGPKELYVGPTEKYDARFTTNYTNFLHYSAFDHALTKTNVTFRRDGCGGAVHSNERKLCEEAFQSGRGQMVSEFVDGFAQSKKGGTNWVNWKIEDALSLHPNYINLLGWQGNDARDFLHERRDLIERGLRQMGYRLVPTRIQFPTKITNNVGFTVEMDWVNRATGRTPRDFEVWLKFVDEKGADRSGIIMPVRLRTSTWIEGKTYSVKVDASSGRARPGFYTLALSLRDLESCRRIALPLEQEREGNFYSIGKIEVVPQERKAP